MRDIETVGGIGQLPQRTGGDARHQPGQQGDAQGKQQNGSRRKLRLVHGRHGNGQLEQALVGQNDLYALAQQRSRPLHMPVLPCFHIAAGSGTRLFGNQFCIQRTLLQSILKNLIPGGDRQHSVVCQARTYAHTVKRMQYLFPFRWCGLFQGFHQLVYLYRQMLGAHTVVHLLLSGMREHDGACCGYDHAQQQDQEQTAMHGTEHRKHFIHLVLLLLQAGSLRYAAS